MSDELIRQDAVTIVGRLKRGEVTPHDLLDALEKRIGAVDGAVNALPTRCFDRARQNADRLMVQYFNDVEALKREHGVQQTS